MRYYESRGGVAFTIMPRSASPLTDSDLGTGRDSPLSHPAAHDASPTPTVIGPEAPPIRLERHGENSIATIRKRLTVALAKSLARCPCVIRRPNHLQPDSVYDTVKLSALGL